MDRIGIKAPLHITINITGFCCLDCVYCYAQPFTGEFIELGKVISILEEVERLGVFQIKIGGGEPLLHPNVFALLEYALEKRMPLAILTSLAVKKQDLVRKFSEMVSPHRFINVQVSLDALDPVINDTVRGNGALVRENIDLMLSHGTHLQIASVITKHNIESAIDLIDFYYPRVKRFHFMNLMPTQKLCQSQRFWDLAPNDGEISAFWERVGMKAISLPRDVAITQNDPQCDTEHEQAFYYPGCSAGVTSCEIDSNLDVLACNIARRFVLGNLSSHSLEEVWNSELAEVVRDSPIPLCRFNFLETPPFAWEVHSCG